MNGLTSVPGSVVEALKSQPSTFAMIVMSFGLLAYTFYEGTSFNSQRLEMLKVVLQYQNEVANLLARCVVPPDALPPAKRMSDDAVPD